MNITLPAFAKINWTLRVLGRRADGYHELRTIFQTVTLHDRIHFAVTAGGSIELTCDDQHIPVDESNLISRAALALRERYVVGRGVRIHLEKRIPTGGGLGGGSANAAVALLGLNSLWNLGMTKGELCAVGSGLGADVPFFFTGGTALGAGIGDDLTPLPDVAAPHLLIVAPGAHVSTAEAYKSLAAPPLTKDGGDTILSSSRAGALPDSSLLDAPHNDFERSVFGLVPEVGRAKRALLEAGARRALMSGSGSCVYGVFDSNETRERAAFVLGGDVGWRVYPCAALSRAEYVSALGACAGPLAGGN